MPDRFMPSDRGILDGFIYLVGTYYVLHGFAWLSLTHPGKLAGIPWFHASLTDDLVGWWFVVGGLAILLGMMFARIPWVRTATMNAAVLCALLPGVLFALAWGFGYYPRGILVASSQIGISAITIWMIVRSAFIRMEDAEHIRSITSEEA